MDTQGRSRERGQSIGFLVPNCPNLVKRAQFLKTQMALMASVCSFSNLVMHHLTLENQIKIPAFMWKGSHKPHLPPTALLLELYAPRFPLLLLSACLKRGWDILHILIQQVCIFVDLFHVIYLFTINDRRTRGPLTLSKVHKNIQIYSMWKHTKRKKTNKQK